MPSEDCSISKCSELFYGKQKIVENLVEMKKGTTFAAEKNKERKRIMATAIKAIPTLYGDEARRFREMADEAERRYEAIGHTNRDSNPFVISMREMLKRSGI